ncbi:MAG: HAMP domain-containing sensor histidine kinase, partial [Synechocystis sp.]|nr:HAMP domain-containing sensor histidine kinase [Synechocystis sp.]
MVLVNGGCLQLSDLFASAPGAGVRSLRSPEQAQLKAQQQWFGAIAAVEMLLKKTLVFNQKTFQGVCLSGPIPILSNPQLLTQIYQGIATPNAWQRFVPLPCLTSGTPVRSEMQQIREFPLFPQDPLAQEQFCWLITQGFSVLLLLGRNEAGMPQFYWSFDPDIIEKAWLSLRSRFQSIFSPELPLLEDILATFNPPPPDFRLVSQFSQLMLDALPDLPRESPTPICVEAAEPETAPEVELLQALTHEIRTPLTSIRTLTRLLLRRKDLSNEVLQRIEAIDRECCDQISRMDLIFRATELESTPLPELVVPLTTTSLEQVFQAAIPRWQHQAKRYNVNLQVEIPTCLPQVWSNPSLLDQVLSGLIEKFVRSLGSGGAIHLQISTAGDQLKVQFHTQSPHQGNPLRALGELLMFQPETGCLSLNWDVTKNLFQLLGGKLTVRRRSPRDPLGDAPLEEILTIYLPLGSAPATVVKSVL